jgi:hypothetical protein
MANPTKYTWVEPTTNTDGTAVVTGEITGYTIGERPASGTPGTYPTLVPVAGATTLSAPITLAAGSWVAAIQSVGPTNSAFSAEVPFTIAPSVPNPPTGFTVS